MKPLSISSLLIFLLLGFAETSFGQTFKLRQTHEDGVYKRGEKMRIAAVLSPKTADSLFIKVWKNNNQILLSKSILPESDSLILFEQAFNESCSVRLDVKIGENTQSTGMIVAPFKLKTGTKRPGDFETYWKEEKQNLKTLRMEVKLKKVDASEPNFECFDTEINCTGPKPARGYFAKPSKAGARSLPIVIIVHAAGVKGSWCRSEPANALNYAKKGKGALCFDLNAHGMLNGQPDEYYSNLENGELKDYYLSGLENREELYFRGMYLRLMRTIEFLCRQPEWDKKRIIVIGESQGGGQALAAAGLDHRVSAVVATVPAMCDWGGTLVNRKGGWPQPFERNGDLDKMKATLPYFDTAHLLKNSTAILVVEIGLIDNTCPSTSVYAAINQAKGKKIIYPVTYREHGWPNAEQRKNWDPVVFNPKNAFVDNYLK